MDLSNNELFQMLLTDIININNQISSHNDTGNMLNNNDASNNNNNYNYSIYFSLLFNFQSRAASTPLLYKYV